METRSISNKVVELLHEARTAEQKFIAELTDAERAQTGQPDRWAAKDILSHMILWQELQAIRLNGAVSGSTPPDYSDFDKLNAENFEAHRSDSWQQINDCLSKSFNDLTNTV